MTRLYLDGNLTLFMPLIKSAAIGSEADGDDKANAYAEFEQDLIDTRNHTMAETGAAHAGCRQRLCRGWRPAPAGRREGLVQLLRDAGYTVTAIR